MSALVPRFTRSPASRTTPAVWVLLHVIAGVASLAPSDSNAGYEKTGRWGAVKSTGTYLVSGAKAIHLCLLHGDATNHSYVVYWENLLDLAAPADTLAGALWAWNPTPGTTEHCSATEGGNFTFTNFVGDPDFHIFCGGHSTLPDGRLLVSSGALLETIGPPLSTIFDPVTKHWKTTAEAMVEGRWYPSNLTLPNGTVLSFGGSSYEEMLAFGGRPDNSSTLTDTSVHRLWVSDGPSGTKWSSAIIARDPNRQTRPESRYHHSLVYDANDTGRPLPPPPILFGGRNASGSVFSDMWFLREERSDIGEVFRWDERFPENLENAGRRWGHTAVLDHNSNMVIFGGVNEFGDTITAPRRWTNSGGFGAWSILTPSGTGPSARRGHAAIVDLAGGRKRMIVFGGVDNNDNPVDNKVWALYFDPLEWKGITPSMTADTLPAGRGWHSLVYDPTHRHDTGPDELGLARRALMYGGRSGSTYMDELWELWIDSDSDSVRWQQLPSNLGGQGPIARAEHSAQFRPVKSRMIIHGGRTGASTVSDSTWALEGLAKLVPTGWARLQSTSNGPPRYGHKAAPSEVNLIYSRIPERYTIGSPDSVGSWTSLDSAYKWVGYYPPVFVLPSGNVFNAGSRHLVGIDDSTYILRQPGTTTASWKGDAFYSPHEPSAAVMYRPGHVLKAGGQHENWPSNQSKRIRFDSSDQPLDSGGWQNADELHAPRINLNLTLMADGKVIATGGRRNADVTNPAQFVRRPEIYDPDAGSSGDWYVTIGGDSLLPAVQDRGYHSTAVLLPDGRIMTAGGDDADDAYSVEVYCPPYLYKPDGSNLLAARPKIDTTVTSSYWGKPFTVCVPDTTHVRGISMIRAGSTTHNFDQDQRFVPLTFSHTSMGGPARFLVDAPADSNIAPPGYYMLFLRGSADRSDVPSIATWVRVGRPVQNDQKDRCDRVRPAIDDMYSDIIGSTEAWFVWSAPADDTLLAASGKGQRFHLRYSTSSLTTESAWSSATPVNGLQTPGVVGTGHDKTVTGLQSCTAYHFALRTEDDNDNLSLLRAVQVETTCGGGGGGFAAPVDPTESATAGQTQPAASRTSAGTYTALAPELGVLVVETARAADGGWEVIVRRVTQVAGIDTSDTGVLVQGLAQGALRSLGHVQPARDQGALGLCSLRDGGRAVVFGDFSLDRIVPRFRSGSQHYSLASATHSTGGALGETFLSGGGSVAISAGDSLTLIYAASLQALEDARGWYLMVGPASGREPAVRESEIQSAGPLQFALHQNEPNPFSRSTLIPFDTPGDAAVKIEGFDLLGRRIATVVDATIPAGSHRIEWNLRDASGSRVRPGVYVYRMSAGDFRARRKMSVLQ